MKQKKPAPARREAPRPPRRRPAITITTTITINIISIITITIIKLIISSISIISIIIIITIITIIIIIIIIIITRLICRLGVAPRRREGGAVLRPRELMIQIVCIYT